MQTKKIENSRCKQNKIITDGKTQSIHVKFYELPHLHRTQAKTSGQHSTSIQETPWTQIRMGRLPQQILIFALSTVSKSGKERKNIRKISGKKKITKLRTVYK